MYEVLSFTPIPNIEVNIHTPAPTRGVLFVPSVRNRSVAEFVGGRIPRQAQGLRIPGMMILRSRSCFSWSGITGWLFDGTTGQTVWRSPGLMAMVGPISDKAGRVACGVPRVLRRGLVQESTVNQQWGGCRYCAVPFSDADASPHLGESCNPGD